MAETRGPSTTLAQWLRDADAVGRELLRLHDEAVALGEVHEARHLHAALVAGNSDGCKPGACTLDPAFEFSSRYGVVPSRAPAGSGSEPASSSSTRRAD